MSQPPTRLATAVWLGTPDGATRFDPSRLDAGERAEWAAVRTNRRRLDWAASRALLGAIPVTGDQSSSLSHSHGFAVVATVATPIAVGVDVEWLAPRDFEGMASLAYSAAEARYLASINDAPTLRARFYEFWTLKEAFAKALRLNLVDALGQCCLVNAAGERRAEIPTARSWRAMVFAPRPVLRLAVAWIAPDTGPLETQVETFEWPAPQSGTWPVILDIARNDDSCGGAW